MRALTKSGIIVAGLALLVVLLVAVDRQATSDISAPSASKVDGAVAAAEAQARTRVAGSSIEAQPTLTKEGMTVRLSGSDRRAGEDDVNYQLRQDFRLKFEKLRDGANLTATQSDEVLAILADTQMQSELAWKELGIAIDELDDERPNMATIRRTLKAEMLSRLREVLSHEQMVTFRRTSLISEPLSLGNYLPLEIAIP